jgi:signal transduction histidine kinase
LDKIVEASELADATIASVKRIAGELRPGVLEDLGLAAALRQEAQRFEERAGVLCRLQLPSSLPTLSREIGTAVFRIFQEALTNVGRHAESTQVEVELTHQGEQLVLRVADNGKGIGSLVLDDARSLGLLGMRERAQSLGGQLTVQPGSPHGTVVELKLPMLRHDPLPTSEPA